MNAHLDDNVDNVAADAPPDAPGSPQERVCPVARVDANWRQKLFLAGLTPARRAAVAARSRFYSMAYLRRADEPADPADELSL